MHFAQKTLLQYIKLSVAVCALFFSSTAQAQSVGIGTSTPNSNAVLDVQHSSKGILIPRMDSVQRKNIPATKGMLVYDSSFNEFWYHTGAAWVNMPGRGNAAGAMLYWNGQRWVTLAAGAPGQFLTVAPGTLLPVWTGSGTSVLTTTAVSSITQSGATSGGNIVSDGGASITARGVVWGTATDPTIALATKTVNGSGTGSFTSNITGLTAGVTYYVRAYATNTNGTYYGNQYNFTTAPASFTIGQAYGGGIIFYVDGTGQHGLIAAPNDQSTGIAWNYNSTPGLVNANGLAIGTGAANTTTIINVQGSSSHAASLCRLYYNGGGFTDWYLPSLYEFTQLLLQRNAVGGFPLFGDYWTSSEFNQFEAWSVNIGGSGPNQTSYGKGSTLYVRAIRAF